jgi:hypothetical protein
VSFIGTELGSLLAEDLITLSIVLAFALFRRVAQGGRRH